MHDAQLAIGQQIEVLQNQQTKFNDHINFHFQQLEEKLSNSSANSESINPIPSQASAITESAATLVIAGLVKTVRLLQFWLDQFS